METRYDAAVGGAGCCRHWSEALVAVARSILVIVWHLLANPAARFHDLGGDYHAQRLNKNRMALSHVRQLQALGFQVTPTRRLTT